jgi:integrase
MAHIQKRNGRWHARWREDDGRERAVVFDRKVDAERWLDGVRGELVRGTYVDPAAGRERFEGVATRWLSIQVHRPTTSVQVRSNLTNHVLPVFGDRPIGTIRPSEVQAWVRSLTSELAPGTVEVIYRYFAAILRAAVEDRIIAVSPCRGIRLPRIEKIRIEPLGTDEVVALADAVDDRYRALVVLAAGTGMRQGEVFGLTLPRLDLLRKVVRVEQQLITVQGRAPYLGPPKTEASVRTIPLPVIVVDSVAAHLAEFDPGDLRTIFSGDKGEPLRRNRFSERVWRPAVARAGLRPGTRFHELRHYYASLLIRHGESVKTVQARLGHASATETLDTYAHLWPDSEDRTREAVDSLLGLAVWPRSGAGSLG